MKGPLMYTETTGSRAFAALFWSAKYRLPPNLDQPHHRLAPSWQMCWGRFGATFDEAAKRSSFDFYLGSEERLR